MKIHFKHPDDPTIEKLNLWFSSSYEAVVPYGNYVVCVTWPWDFETREEVCVGAVFAFTTEDHSIEAPLSLRKVSEISFPDTGHALEWGFNLAKLLTDVVAAFEKEG